MNNWSQILNPLEVVKRVASLHRNSVSSDTALASTAATSWQSEANCPGPSDRRGALVYHERFPWTWILVQNALRSFGRCPQANCLSGEPRYLSLHRTLLSEQAQTGNADPTHTPNRDSHSLHPPQRDGTHTRFVDIMVVSNVKQRNRILKGLCK